MTYSESKEQLNQIIQSVQDQVEYKEDIIMTILKYMFVGKDYNDKEIILCKAIHSDENAEDFQLIKNLLVRGETDQ